MLQTFLYGCFVSGVLLGVFCKPSEAQVAPVTTFVSFANVSDVYQLERWPDEQSAQAMLETQTLLELQKNRTSDDVRQAVLDSTRSPLAWAADENALGATFSKQRYPLVIDLLEKIHDDTRLINRAANAKWGARVRPYALDSRIVPALKTDNLPSASYPSARAASSLVWGLFLAELFPERKQALLAHAHRSAALRVIAGVHFPSDVEAAHKVAQAYFTLLQRNGEYRRLLSAAKLEVLKAPCTVHFFSLSTQG
jgi:acid phosphatase (class A)